VAVWIKDNQKNLEPEQWKTASHLSRNSQWGNTVAISLTGEQLPVALVTSFKIWDLNTDSASHTVWTCKLLFASI